MPQSSALLSIVGFTSVILAATLTCLTAGIGTSREWTDIEGRTIRATLVEISDDHVKLNVGGVVHEVPVSRLSASCRKWLSAFQESPDDTPQDKPGPGSPDALQLELLELPPSDKVAEIVRAAAFDLQSTIRPGIFLRMDRNVTLSVHGGDEMHAELIGESVAMIEDAIGDSRIRLRLLNPNRTADITIFLAEQQRFADIALIHNFVYLNDSPSYWTSVVDGDILKKGAIFIDPSQRQGLSFQRYVVRGIISCLGVRGWSPEVEGSMFNRQRFGAYDPTQIGPLDQAIIIFCLRNLDSGSNETDFTQAFKGRWAETVRLVERNQGKSN